MDNEVQVMTAYKMYADLKAGAKAQVDVTKLNAAMTGLESDLAAKADFLINAIGEVTLKSEPAIREARNYYDALPEEAKAKVTKLSVLEAAEERIAALKKENPTFKNLGDPGNDKGGNLWLFIGIGAAAVIAAAVVVVILLRKKKPTEE